MMLRRGAKKKAQSLAEYAVVIGAVTAVLAVMGLFVSGALQGRIRTMATSLGDRPYDPGHTESQSQSSVNSTVQESYRQGVIESEFSDTSETYGSETVYNDED